jgi:hypothetical protein
VELSVPVGDLRILVTKEWSETAYRDLTQNVQLLPFEFDYLCAVLALCGIEITIFGMVKK